MYACYAPRVPYGPSKGTSIDRLSRRGVAVSAVVVLAASVATIVLAAGRQQPGMPFSYAAGEHPVAVAEGGGIVYAAFQVGTGTPGVLSLPDAPGPGARPVTVAAGDFGGGALAADADGNLYYDTVQGGVAELPRGTGRPRQLPLDIREYDKAGALAADDAGDVFVVCGSGTLIEIPAGATTASPDILVATGGSSPGNYSYVRSVAVDANRDLFLLTDGAGVGVTGGFQVLELPARWRLGQRGGPAVHRPGIPDRAGGGRGR